MAVGDLINYTNYVALDGSSWRRKYGTLTSAGSRVFYVSAPAFQANTWICGTGWWGYQEAGMSIYPYDESTGAFSTTAVFSNSGSVRGGSDKKEWTFNHNYNGGHSKDVHDCHLWKISSYLGDNDGTKGFWLYVGGLGVVKETLYEPYFKGRYIYCSKGDLWQKGSGTNQYASDEAFLQAQGYSCMRGTQISIATGTYKYICAKPLLTTAEAN